MKGLVIKFFLFQYAFLLVAYSAFAQPNQECNEQELRITVIQPSASHADRENHRLEDLLVACEEDEDDNEPLSIKKHLTGGVDHFLRPFSDFTNNYLVHSFEQIPSSESLTIFASCHRLILFGVFRV